MSCIKTAVQKMKLLKQKWKMLRSFLLHMKLHWDHFRRFKKILQYSTELFANIRLTFANKRIFYAKMTPNFRQKKIRIILGIIHASENLVSFNLCSIMNKEHFDENCFLLTSVCSPPKIFQKCYICNFYRQIRYSANFVQIKIV